jgi:D-inositol-3-phosphate glycosyltransferase
MNANRISIIDPVGVKAGLDLYDVSLAVALNNKSFNVIVFSNFNESKHSFVRKQFTFFLKQDLFSRFRVILEFYKALQNSKKANSRIVILHLFQSSFSDYLLTGLTKMFGFRICIIVHDVESLLETRNHSWLKKILQIVEIIIVHNTVAFEDLVMPDFLRKISIIPHGNFIDVVENKSREESLQAIGLPAGKKYILFFGMIKKSKGLGDLIEAMKDISGEINLIIAGRTRDVDFQEYEALIRKMDLSGRIHSFIRYISIDERNLLFNIADAVVIPYHRIYQSGVMMMAMSYGVPVIASDLPANKLMINEKNGLLFKVGNSSDLAQKINFLFSDSAMRENMGANGKKYVAENNAWELIANHYAKIL